MDDGSEKVRYGCRIQKSWSGKKDNDSELCWGEIDLWLVPELSTGCIGSVRSAFIHGRDDAGRFARSTGRYLTDLKSNKEYPEAIRK